MRTPAILVALTALFPGHVDPEPATSILTTAGAAMQKTIEKLSPILVVDDVEPCLPFWTDRLGFEVTVTVPHEEALGFAIVERDGVEVMYQSRASVAADIPSLAAELGGQTTTLFIEVVDLDRTEEALAGAEILVPRRRTFYGMDEIFVRAPCGTVVGLAARVGDSED